MTLKNGRILVVDDLPDWRAMIGGLLQELGYEVSVAEDEEGAMRLLRERSYHLALVDLRLDERNEQDRAGLALARRMKEHLPELAVIILTAYADVSTVIAALEPHADGKSIAFDFLEKSAIQKLPQRVKIALDKAARVNPKLEIGLDLGISWKLLAKDIECLRPLGMDEAQQEIVDLLQRLFYEAERIRVKPLSNGHGGGSVVLVTPTIRNIPQTDVVVKFNERTKAEQEAFNYDQYVARYIGGARRTQQLDIRATARLGGIAYSFVGAAPTKFERFREAYVQLGTPTLRRVVESLFLETCQPWYTKTLQVTSQKHSLGSHYREALSLSNQKLERSLMDLVGRQENNELMFEDPGQPLQSPVRLVERDMILPGPLTLSNSPFPYTGPLCYTHGDLHEDNIIVDNHQDTWLIDFYNTGLGHPARDFAMLECAIKFHLQSSKCSLSVFHDWERNLVEVSSFSEEPSLRTDGELAKAATMIVHIRGLLHQILPDVNLRDYLVALYFHALKGITLARKFTERQRHYALTSAALLAEVLRNSH